MLMENNSREDIMNLGLNQEPLDQSCDSVIGVDTIRNDLETAHGCIEDRIRRFEAVTTRRRRRRRHSPTVTEPVDTAHVERHDDDDDDDCSAAQERIVHSGKTSKKERTHLVAQALATDTELETSGNKTGRFYDCNICLDAAKDPILTCCGHLFCWSCFYQLSYVYSNYKECPECQGEIADTSIIPIYGHSNSSRARKSNHGDSGLKVPPRPLAQRIESMRQQILSRATPASLIEGRFQQINNIIDAVGDQLRLPNFDATLERIERTTSLGWRRRAFEVLPVNENESNQQNRALHRLRPQFAVSISSLSSALTSAVDSVQIMIDHLDTNNHNRSGSRSLPPALSNNPNNGDPLSGIAATVRSDGTTLDPVDGGGITSSVAQFESSSRGMDIDSNTEHLENQASSATEFDRIILPTPSTRRRSDLPQRSDTDNEILRERSRRRLG